MVLPDDPEIGLLLISSCPAQANAASPDALLCELHVLKPAVDPATRLFYKVIIKELERSLFIHIKNSFCLQCWNQTAQLADLLARGVNNRSCVPSLHDCGAGHRTNKINQKCKEYVSPVSMRHPMGATRDLNASHPGSLKLFRNKDCIACMLNNEPKMDTKSQCYNPFMHDKNLRFGKS